MTGSIHGIKVLLDDHRKRMWKVEPRNDLKMENILCGIADVGAKGQVQLSGMETGNAKTARWLRSGKDYVVRDVLAVESLANCGLVNSVLLGIPAQSPQG